MVKVTDFTQVTPQLVAIVGDWHADAHWAANAIDLTSEMGADLVISVGDFGFWPKWTKGQNFLMKLSDKLAETNTALWWIDGNHEDHETLARLPLAENGLRPVTHNIFHIPRGFRWTWEGFTWMGLGGAVSVDQTERVEGADWFAEEVISEEDAAYAMREGAVQVMLTHEGIMGAPALDMRLAMPSGWPAEVIQKANVQRHLLTTVVEAVAPSYLFHGHHHYSYTNNAGSTLVRGLSCNGSSMSDNIAFVDYTGARCA